MSGLLSRTAEAHRFGDASQVLEFDDCARAKDRRQTGQQCRERNRHRAENDQNKYNSSLLIQFEVSRGTGVDYFQFCFPAPFQISVASSSDVHPASAAVAFGVLRKQAMEVHRDDFRKHSDDRLLRLR
jgi:hypothetical protein